MTTKYRPEIEGLRAIAVVAVLLYHAEFLIFGSDPFKDGFLGVDAFFVISGYLILVYPKDILCKDDASGALQCLLVHPEGAIYNLGRHLSYVGVGLVLEAVFIEVEKKGW